MSSPAERYAAARRRTAHPTLADFTADLGFFLDPFQVEACEALEEGSGVLVCAPTGAGKTVVGEFAVHKALAEGRKAFYTTPIKALSNQKYADLVERYGERRVGLLPGDNAISGDAPVVVMTTEVLRNMLYAESPAIDGLGYVVMDEVHYLADRFRGAVWEEVIIHLPPSVTLVSLSATVSNAEEFADWLVTVRGDTAVVVSEVRPVPLWQHMLVGNRVFDLFSLRPAAHAAEPGLEPRALSTRERGASVVDPELVRFVREHERRIDSWDGGGSRSRNGFSHRPRYRPPSRPSVLERLVKWNGEAHVDVTPGEYTQLTGRAGRRGIDVEGHAVVIWAPGMDPAVVAGLASTRTYPLRSSFRPSYNMAVNLVSSFGRARARELLASSFAQFQADRSVVGLARAAARHERDAERLAAEMSTAVGDVAGYAQLRREIADRERALSRDSQSRRRAEAAETLAALRPGDVIRVPSGRRQGLAVVLDPGVASHALGEDADPRPLVLTEDRWAGRLSTTDFP